MAALGGTGRLAGRRRRRTTHRRLHTAAQHRTADEEFAFRLTANPVQTVQRPDKPSEQQTQRLKILAGAQEKRRGFRVAHRTAARQPAWLLARAERHGFPIPAARTASAIDLGTSAPAEPAAGPAPAVSLIARETQRFAKSKNAPASRSPAPPSREGSG
nr:type I-E CRISPR-associated protein Cas6/Cse3/CasE [Streptomyces achromogenes]